MTLVSGGLLLISCEQDRSKLLHADKMTNGEYVTAIKILIVEEGLYELSSADLKTAGMEVIEPTRLHLFKQGQEVPLWIDGQSDDLLLQFFAHETGSLYTNENIYWLVNGDDLPWSDHKQDLDEVEIGTPLQIPDELPQGVYQATTRAEENQIYLPQVADNEHWFWAMLPAPQEQSYEISINNVSQGPASLYLALWSKTDGESSPDHHVRVAINGHQVVEEYWDGIGRHIIEAKFSSELLKNEQNIISIEAPGDTAVDADINYIDWIEMKYPRFPVAENDRLIFNHPGSNLSLSGFSGKFTVYDITNPSEPILITKGVDQTKGFDGELGHRYLAIGPQGTQTPFKLQVATTEPNLHASGYGAEYLAIGPQELLEPLQPLLKWREAQGLKVAAVPVSAIYDQFNYGMPEPEAIQAFIKQAAEDWNPTLKYLLLVGDATYDPKGFQSPTVANRIPSLMVNTVFGGQTSSDVAYTQINDDPWPDIAIGRIPARTVEQVSEVVGKTIDYELNLAQSSTHGKVVAVADGQDDIFREDAENFLDLFPTYQQREIFSPQAGVNGANRQIMELLSGDNSLVAYFGHGSINMWGKDRLFTTEDVTNLSNAGRLPVILNMTCLTGLFTHPNVESLAEALLFQPDGGAVAVLAPSSLTLPTDQSFLIQALVPILLEKSEVRLGDIHLASLRQVPTDSPGSLDVMQTFMLFGDPALRFPGYAR